MHVAAAEREVNEETGHDVSVHEFLGTLVYDSRGGPKVVHFWRMEAGREPVERDTLYHRVNRDGNAWSTGEQILAAR